MKGITNYEMREYFETITKEIQELKRKPVSSADITIFLVATITAITSTLLFILQPQNILLFFIISSVAIMGAILIKKQIEGSS